MASHLTTLIKRVRSIPHKMRVDPKIQPIFYGRLINLAEYMRYESDYSQFEESKAKALLKAHGFEFLTEADSDEEFENRIRALHDKSSRVCIRCGRALSDPNSVRRGYGEECYGKRLIVDAKQGKLESFFGDSRFEERTDEQ